MSRITQKDIAKRLGLSQATVSAVLSNNSSIKIAEGTRERILAEAEKLSYWPNQLANALLARKSRIIGVAFRNTFSQVVTRKVNEVVMAIEEAGYLPLAFDVSSRMSGEKMCQFLRDFNVEGIVVLNGTRDRFLEDNYPKYLKGVIPAVAIDTPKRLDIPQFHSDRKQGFGLVAEHLIRQGRRRLAILVTVLPEASPDLPFTHSYGCVEGISEKLREAGLEPPHIEFYRPNTGTWGNPHEGGEVTMEALLASGKSFDAVVCGNDPFAIGALSVCARHGIRVPEDLAITGFQNEIQAGYAQPPLTTVEVPVELLARTAVSHLTNLVTGEACEQKHERIMLPCSLVVRESCGAPLRKLVR